MTCGPEFTLTSVASKGATIPLAHDWLDDLVDAKEALRPFSVAGSRYSGYKWKPLHDHIKRPLLNHLNGSRSRRKVAS